MRTDSKAFGFSPKAWRMVGATCMVSTGLVTVARHRCGWDSNIITLVSSCENPPCSASFLVLAE
jgi:hypothetical protein